MINEIMPLIEATESYPQSTVYDSTLEHGLLKHELGTFTYGNAQVTNPLTSLQDWPWTVTVSQHFFEDLIEF